MTIKPKDIKFYHSSIHIEKINKQKLVESLYFLDDELISLGYSLDVCDFDYLNYFVAHLSSTTFKLINISEVIKNRFILDLCKIINNKLEK